MRTVPHDEKWVAAPENSILADLAAEERALLAAAHTSYQHRVGKGDYREELFRDFLNARLPRSVDSCKGHVQDCEGRCTSEFDILLYDPNFRMVIAKADRGRMVLPVESVVAVIEIRSKINVDALEAISDKIAELSKLQRRYSEIWMGGDIEFPQASIGARENDSLHRAIAIPVFLVGFDSDSPDYISAKWERLAGRPDVVACLGKFAICDLSPTSSNADATLFEAPSIALASLMLRLTARIVNSASSPPVPDLLRYFRLPKAKN